jgi:hypothetical protein
MCGRKWPGTGRGWPDAAYQVVGPEPLARRGTQACCYSATIPVWSMIALYLRMSTSMNALNATPSSGEGVSP